MLILHKIFYLLFCFAVLLLLSCNSQHRSFKQVRISIPEHLNITESDIMNKIPKRIIDKSSNFDLELTIFAFCGGIEKINYTGGDDFNVSISDASIKILVKVIKNSEIVETRIIEASGKEKVGAIENAMNELNR